MAGIGFLLKDLVREDRYEADFRANLYALLISSGPWVCAVVCIAALSVFSNAFMTDKDLFLFRAIIIYTYAFSLIFSSFFQLILTRFLSDKLYQKEYSSLLPNSLGALILCGLCNFAISSLYMSFTPLSFHIKALSVILFCVVGFQWIVLIFLSTLRDYVRVAFTFFAGFILSFTAAMLLGTYFSITGFLSGFLLGQIIILLLLIERITSEFPLGKDKPYEFLRYFKRFPVLIWGAIIYNAGFWIDKILIWYSPFGYDIEHSFRAQHPYDSASFLAALTCIPALSIFFLSVETDFYGGLRKYIWVILSKGTLETIEGERIKLISTLKKELLSVFEVQFLITLIVIILSPYILDGLGYNRYEITPTFVILLIGSFFQIFFLTLIMLCWYLELLKESHYCILLFAILNAALNYILIYYAPTLTLGFGYLGATFMSAFVTLLILMNRLKELNYLIFTRTPLVESQHEIPRYTERL